MHKHGGHAGLKDVITESVRGKGAKWSGVASVRRLSFHLASMRRYWVCAHTPLRKRRQVGSSRSAGINFIREQTEKNHDRASIAALPRERPLIHICTPLLWGLVRQSWFTAVRLHKSGRARSVVHLSRRLLPDRTPAAQ